MFVGMTAYEKWSAGDGLSDSNTADSDVIELVDDTVYSYPTNVDIESIDGRQLTIKLIARNGTHIQFDRLTDQQRFVYPIADLVPASRELIEKFPNKGIIDASKHVGEGGLEFADAYIEQLREAIRRIDEKAAALEREYSQTDSKTAKRTIVRKLEELKRERFALTAKIAERD